MWTLTKSIRVYLVEDEELIRESLSAMLNLDPEIDVVGGASDAEQALQDIEHHEVDVVLMDIHLPGIDGVEATHLLKERDRDLAVVMVTSHDGEYLTAAMEAGATGYIRKSCTREQLIQAVRNARQGQASVDPSLTAALVRELARLRRAYREKPHDSPLTRREAEVLRSLASGAPNKEIAEQLSVSVNTVKYHVENVFQKLDVHTRGQAVRAGFERGLLNI